MGPQLATVSLLLLTFFSNSIQYPHSPAATECPAYFNGNIAGNACSREYSICVNGVRQAATCSDDSVFYEDECVPVDESPECRVDENTEEDDTPYAEFDCTSKQDGIYSIGCSNQFISCVAGGAYMAKCPDSLVFNERTQDCRESCDEVKQDTTTAPQVYEDGEEGYGEASGEIAGDYERQPSNEQPDSIDFDCNGLEDGNYADGCNDVFYSCSNNMVFQRYCPPGTVFNINQQSCDFQCTTDDPTTTVSYSTSTITTPQEDDSEYSSTTSADVISTTTTPSIDAIETTTTGFDAVTTTTTTQTPFVCQEGQVNSFGMCSSRFNRCQNNSVRSKQCPVNTLFESSLVMCVFDLPQCQPITVPAAPAYNSYGPPSDTIVSPFDENVRLKPKFDRRRKYHHGKPSYGPVNGNSYLENPFFIPRHRGGSHRDHRRYGYGPAIDSPFSTAFRGRAALSDQFKDYRRARMGKIQGDARKVDGNKRFLIDDEFEGPNAKFVESNIEQVFPKNRHSKKQLGPHEDPDGYDDEKTFDAKDLFGATRRKRSAYYGTEQSVYGQHSAQISARQAQGNKDCQQYTTPTFLTFGDCFDQFIFCSGNGINRMAACPIGETFDKTLRSCSETCGVSTTIVAVTIGTQTSDDLSAPSEYIENDGVTTQSTWNDQPSTTQAPNSYESYTTQYSSNDVPSTSAAPIGDRCSLDASGLFSLGCSQKYIQCSNGAAIVRRCGESLYFNEATQECTYRDEVPECGSQGSTSSPVITTPGQDQSSNYYGIPSDDVPSTTQTPVGDRCAYVASGLFDLGCSQKYIQCSDSAASVRECEGSLYFDERSQSCRFRDEVFKCQTADVSSSSTVPYLDFTTTPASPSEDEPTTYEPSVAPYIPSVTVNPVDTCTSLSDGTHGTGCSSFYFVCSHGRLISSGNCQLGEGYDPSVQGCRTFSEIPARACDEQEVTTDAGLVQLMPYKTLEEVLTTTEAATTVANDGPTDTYITGSTKYSTTDSGEYTIPYGDETTSTRSYDRADNDSEDEEEDDVEHDQKCTVGSRTPVGFCVRTYLECTDAGNVEKLCRIGKLFDSHSNRCVPRIGCGKEAIRDAIKDMIATTPAPAQPKQFEGRCAHVDGEAVFSIGVCSSKYLRCSYGASKLQQCSEDRVFSNDKLECIVRESVSACTVPKNPSIKKYYTSNDQSAFCDGKEDGLYRNERDCSAILQCFGGELFEHPSCQSSLAFNQLTGKCDYPQKVSGCENHGQTNGECSEHGSFIADANNCEVFYRCVWGRKVVMTCPSGTVFNPLLSVCDWPSAVPSCSGQASDSNSSYGSSTYNDDKSGY